MLDKYGGFANNETVFGTDFPHNAAINPGLTHTVRRQTSFVEVNREAMAMVWRMKAPPFVVEEFPKNNRNAG